MPRHLYVHVPFCAHRCGYCTFVTVTGREELHARYVDGLRRELELRMPGLDLQAAFDTTYVGGGTPSLLAAGLLDELLGWLAAMLAPGGELTVEANPETIDPDRAAVLAAHGARVSMGVQSLHRRELDLLDRTAGPEVVAAAVGMLRAAGVSNLSCDLIWGIPDQDPADLRADLAGIVDLAPEHVSAYELEVRPGTMLHHRLGGAPDPDEDDDRYRIVVDVLEAAGYDWYELANFARAGCESRHNLAYWTQRDHVGIGIGAFGTVGARRRRNLPGIGRWLEALEAGRDAPHEVELLDDHTRRLERVMLAARLREPVDLQGMDDVIDPLALDRLQAAGLLAGTSDRIELTRSGRMLQGAVMAELLQPR